MIGGLLKELVKALGRYAHYQVSRIFGRPRQRPLPQSGVVTPEQIATLDQTVDLDPAYRRPIRWQTDRDDMVASEVRTNPIFQLWGATPHSHKWTHYFETYQSIFEPRHHSPMRILEIGVLNGSSLRLWKKYFEHPRTSVVGIDIDPGCARFDAPSENIHVRIGSQADPDFLKEVVREFGVFDLIIDDGSHNSSHMIKTFNCLYASGLEDNGIYFVEDLHANYWLPWRDSAKSFIDFCKDLIELMHAHYQQADLSAWRVEAANASRLVLQVPEITTMIGEIRFFDSMVAIYKKRRANLPRYIVS
jgi:hypothetical protein